MIHASDQYDEVILSFRESDPAPTSHVVPRRPISIVSGGHPFSSGLQASDQSTDEIDRRQIIAGCLQKNRAA
jgi:hypothetical protein